jgi:hypothetical protein
MGPSQPDADMLPYLVCRVVVDVACQVQPQVVLTGGEIRLFLRVSARISGCGHCGGPDAQAAVLYEDKQKVHVCVLSAIVLSLLSLARKVGNMQEGVESTLSGRTRNTRNLAWVRLRWTAPKSNVQGAAVLHCEALRHRFIAKFEISDIRGCFAREEGSRRRNGLVESYYILSWRTNSCRRPGRLLPGCANRRAPPAILGVRRTRWDGMRPRLVLPSPVIGASMVTVRGQLSWLFVCFFVFWVLSIVSRRRVAISQLYARTSQVGEASLERGTIVERK